MKNIIRKFIKLFQQTEVHVLLFIIALVIFSWPFIHEYKHVSQGSLYFYIHSFWLLLIILLFFISYSYRLSSKLFDDDEDDNDEND